MEGEGAVEVEVVDEEEDLEDGVDRKVMEVEDRKVMEVEVTVTTRPSDPEIDTHQAMDQDTETINLTDPLI